MHFYFIKKHTMHNGQTISLKTILWKVLKNPLATDLTYEEAAEYTIEAIRLLGAPLSFIDKVSDPLITIQNYKGVLPSNLLDIRGVRVITDINNYEHCAIPLRHATDIYHTGLSCSEPTGNDHDSEYSIHTPDPTGSTQETYTDFRHNPTNMMEYTYTTQKGIIYTSIKEGQVQMSYRALAVDEDGYPLIPNDQKTIMAIHYYILHRFLEPLWMLGKITDKAFTYIEQKRHFYMGGAGNSLQLAGIDHLESIMNTINRLIVNTQAHTNFYKGSGLKERLKKYN